MHLQAHITFYDALFWGRDMRRYVALASAAIESSSLVIEDWPSFRLASCSLHAVLVESVPREYWAFS